MTDTSYQQMNCLGENFCSKGRQFVILNLPKLTVRAVYIEDISGREIFVEIKQMMISGSYLHRKIMINEFEAVLHW